MAEKTTQQLNKSTADFSDIIIWDDPHLNTIDHPKKSTTTEAPLLDTQSIQIDFNSKRATARDVEEVAQEVPNILPAVNDDNIANCLTHLQTVTEKMDILQKDFATKIKEDQHKTQLIDQLHAEVQQYKSGLLEQLTLPIIKDLIAIYDDLCKTIQQYQSTVTQSADATPATLADWEGYQQQIQDVLGKQGVFAYQEETLVFNAKVQQALAITPTTEVALGRTIRCRLKPGFKRGDRVIRLEGVDVYKYRPNTESPRLAPV